MKFYAQTYVRYEKNCLSFNKFLCTFFVWENNWLHAFCNCNTRMTSLRIPEWRKAKCRWVYWPRIKRARSIDLDLPMLLSTWMEPFMKLSFVMLHLITDSYMDQWPIFHHYSKICNCISFGNYYMNTDVCHQLYHYVVSLEYLGINQVTSMHWL